VEKHGSPCMASKNKVYPFIKTVLPAYKEKETLTIQKSDYKKRPEQKCCLPF
jgi:hypothetical protein